MKLRPWILSAIILYILGVIACAPKKNFIKYAEGYDEVGKLFSSVRLP